MNATTPPKRRVLITGGASGIGFAAARTFAERGDHVIICGRNAEKLAAARARLAEFGDIETCTVDVANQHDVETMFANLLESSGGKPIDVLVASAGTCQQARLDEPHSDDVWHNTIATNLNGVYYCLKAASKNMPDGGNIVVVSSGLGKNARAGFEAYVASKHAVLGLAKCVALELAPRQIRVNSVCPGWVDTEMSRADAANSAKAAGISVEEFHRNAISGIPLGRMVTPEEVADLIEFLCSDKSSAITGQSYNISGGEFFN